MTTKKQILAEIQRIAVERGGHVSLDNFLAATGLREKQILGKHWSKWNDAIEEAGLKVKKFGIPRAEDSDVVEALAKLIDRLGKWPSETELRMAKQDDPEFPSVQVIRRLKRGNQSLASRVAVFCSDSASLDIAARVAKERAKLEGNDRPALGNAPINGYVYMMRSGRRYKIGRTNSPSRRHREVRLDLPEPTSIVHEIPTDDPPGIESYWHQRFSAKRVRDTEFFTLDATDVAAFKRRKYQ